MDKGLTIDGLIISGLKQIRDERGAVFHYLRSTDPSFKGFGEAYYSKINEGVIKGWKLHRSVYQNFCVPYGAIKLVIYDNRAGSVSEGCIDEIILNDDLNYSLLSMPPGLWYSFKCVSKNFALLANIIDQTHFYGESENLPLDTSLIKYDWSK
ncbi:MAG: dTDP-4-dehydrorhamnose 3,5-epimerase family protein [Candidatus Pedobacter colombiensis]|uniref:dTDP-4-dehydrorhamnose 3,5-epimerase family protein n=1 Tax=Candidatus Pedobacter colombiensis TaxID=3121371 RepID=A0AAJ5WBE8_9SPHI|nr:dTDP-4-dehydrorhamnose 3,5-epimerase family protein [Pedobacter sp.]WEK19677.1 MAG: dTDP-4-dehydrorhamnose 3,5-epimerase family protein [Pedobacter sp.]